MAKRKKPEQTETPVTTTEQPVVEQKPDETPKKSAKKDEKPVEKKKFSTEEMHKGLNKVYDVRFAFSVETRRFSFLKKMSILQMFDMFVKNRYTFVALTKDADYKAVEEFLNNNDIVYDYQPVSKGAIEQFLEKLKENTEYIVNRYG